MAFNGYRNYETWAFMLYFEEYLYEILKEQQEYNDEEITYSTVYETVEHILDELSDSVDRVEFGYPFIKDMLNAAFSEIDKKEVADHLIETLNDEN